MKTSYSSGVIQASSYLHNEDTTMLRRIVMHNIFVTVLCSNYLTNQFNLQTQCCFIMSNNITRMTDHINTGDIIIEHV